MIMHIKVLYISDYVMGYHDNAYQSVVHTRFMSWDTMIMHIKVLYIPIMSWDTMIMHIKVLYISDYVMGYHDNAYQSVV